MRLLLDTTVLIDHANGRPGVGALVRELFSESNDLFVCDVVVAEATSGVHEDELAAIITSSGRGMHLDASDAALWAEPRGGDYG
jgi:predicted nucleic acid-binding protein